MAWKLLPLEQFSQFESDWDRLNSKNANTPIMQTRFVKLLIEYFSNKNEILAVYQDTGPLLAITILSKTQFGTWETFQPSQSPLGFWIHDPDVDVQSLLPSLADTLDSPTLLLGITQLDPNIYPRPESTSKLRTLDYIKTAKITIDGTFDDYWSKRGKNLRQNMNRQRNRLAREEVETKLVTINESKYIENAIIAYGELESAGWKAGGGTAIKIDNAQGMFYTALLKSYSDIGEGRIYQYWYDDKLVATDICISGNGIIIILKTTYDESQKTSSPALLMRRQYFEQLFDQEEFQHIEFFGKVMSWHTKWSDEIRTMYHINYYRWPAVIWIKKLKEICKPSK